MQLTSQQALPVSQAIAWQALNDTAILQAAIPGCESITATGDDSYEVALTAAVGPVKAKFKGKMKLADINPPESYTIHFEGQGGAAGHGKGSASVKLEPQGEHACLLHYTANASVGGKLAQIGSRLIDMAAQKMAGDFFAAFEQQLAERYPRPADAPVIAAAPNPQGLWQRLLAWLGLGK
jgi:carbon monoxide dehydrogenase subunit G